MSQRVYLVTGAAGFIGSHVTDRLLAQGHHVVGVDNFCDFYDPDRKRRNLAAALQDSRFTLIEADIRDQKAVNETFLLYKPHVVIHLAAMAGVRPSIENPSLYTQVNLDGTVHLLDAAVKRNTQKFVFASSSSVYGNNPKVPFAEGDRVDHPISPYAATKKAGELICHTYHHVHHLPVSCLRFFTVFGPRQRPDLAISKFLLLVSQGKSIPMFGDGSTSRDYTYIDDIVTGVLAAADRCSSYHIYNLGGSSPVSLREMISTIEQVVGKKALIEQKPMQPGDVERTWADLTVSQKELDYQPTTSLREGIARQWQWLQQQGS